MKIFGSDGVECTFRSPFQTATKQLQFLENKGALLRLTTVSTLHTVLRMLHMLPRSGILADWCELWPHTAVKIHAEDIEMPAVCLRRLA